MHSSLKDLSWETNYFKNVGKTEARSLVHITFFFQFIHYRQAQKLQLKYWGIH